MATITIYEKDETDFSSLGLGVLAPSNCVITEEINGIYELEMLHPFDVNGYYTRLQNERIILADTPMGKQPFRIYRLVPTLDAIRVNAKHIFYDLLDNFIEATTIIGTATQVLTDIVAKMTEATDFVFSTDITTSGTVKLKNENIVSALLNTDKDNPKFIQVFQGEIVRDKWNVAILQNSGANRDVFIRYGKNLTGIQVSEDLTNVVTKLYPIGKDGITLPNKFITSPLVNNYYKPKIQAVEFSDATTVEELTELAKKYLEEHDKPLLSIDVSFVTLRQTQEYKNFQFLEDVFIGDTVTILVKKLGIVKQAKVIKYSFNSLSQSYDSITIGEFKPILTNTISQSANKIDGLTTSVGNISEMTNNLQDTVATLENKLNGKIQIVNDELLILDNKNITQARTIYKFNSKGISKSTTGINGAFTNILN